jgi:hypothetical protein
MNIDPVVIVHLRRPTSEHTESRSDPFWEFGSFGITGCHNNNLMHLRNGDSLMGVRFAFAQGGRLGMRLVYLTPPIAIVTHPDRIEATWIPIKMPFRYDCAPILVRNSGLSDFPRLLESLHTGNRPTLEGQFSSNYRSRATCIDGQIAEEIVRVYDSRRRNVPKSVIASNYVDALPWVPPNPDSDREQTYRRRLDEARQPQPKSKVHKAKKQTCKPLTHEHKPKGGRC